MICLTAGVCHGAALSLAGGVPSLPALSPPEWTPSSGAPAGTEGVVDIRGCRLDGHQVVTGQQVDLVKPQVAGCADQVVSGDEPTLVALQIVRGARHFERVQNLGHAQSPSCQIGQHGV